MRERERQRETESQAIQRLVEDPEGLFQRPFGIVTFDQHVTFFTLTKTKRFYSAALPSFRSPTDPYRQRAHRDGANDPTLTISRSYAYPKHLISETLADPSATDPTQRARQ